MKAATVRSYFKNPRFATAVYCVGVLVTGVSFGNSIFSFSIAAALCIGLFYRTSACGSRIKAAKPLLFNSGLLALVVVLLRVIRNKVGFHFPPTFWSMDS